MPTIRPVYSETARSYLLSVDELPEGMHRRKAHRRNGRWVRETIVRNPRRRRKAALPAPPPAASPHQGRSGLVVSLTIAATFGIGALTLSASLNGSSTSGDSLTVQVKADLTQAIAALAELGFHSTRSMNTRSPKSAAGCAASATGEVRQFLTRHPCKEDATTILTTHRQGTTTQLAMSWVVMPTSILATQYRAKVNREGLGNPPGEPPAFNGLCYASGQNGLTVWAEQVKPTGDSNVDREILQAAAPSKLTSAYLHLHCIS